LISTKGSGYIKSKRVFNDFSCILSGKRHLRFRETAREGAIAEFFSRNFMKFRYSIAMITERIATDKPEQCINNMLRW